MQTSVLITAGATRNPIDSMRSITANSSGKTGVGIGKILMDSQFECTLLGSNLALLQPGCPDQTIEFTSTRDLLSKMKFWLLANPTGIVVHAAAVGDFEVSETVSGKISSGQELTLNLKPTPKIVNHIKDWAPNSKLISFKAAAPDTTPEALEQLAKNQCQRTHSDLVFANVLGQIETDVLLHSSSGTTWYPKRKDGLNALIATILQWR